MGKPISDDLRAHVVDTVEGGATIPEAAEQFGVSIRSVVRFLKLYRETGSVSPARFGGYKDFALAEHEYLVRQLVAEQPDITLEELGARLAREGIAVGKSSISRFLHHLELTFKRSFRLPDGVDADKIEASFKNGLLKVALPKTPETQKPEKKIEVKAG